MKTDFRCSRGSILVVVLVTLLLASLALTVFIEKASDDMLVESREGDARRLREEAYSSLETVLAVLVDFRTVNSSLRSPSEGWGDPLTWASYTPAEGRKVVVEFKDESGKLSLPHATQSNLVDLFVSMQIPQTDAERLADAMLYWIQHEHNPTTSYTPAYDLDSLPCDPPGRSLRSWGELASIDLVRETFFEQDGRPNALWKRFTDSVSLYDFSSTNINAATPDMMAVMGFDLNQQSRMQDFIAGKGSYQSQGAGYFKSTADVATLAGKDASGVTTGTEISALRIIITVWDGRSHFRLNTVVTPTGSSRAKIITALATSSEREASTTSTTNSTTSSSSSSSGSTRTSTSSSSSTPKALNYPFVFLEMLENDEISTPPAEPAVSQ